MGINCAQRETVGKNNDKTRPACSLGGPQLPTCGIQGTTVCVYRCVRGEEGVPFAVRHCLAIQQNSFGDFVKRSLASLDGSDCRRSEDINMRVYVSRFPSRYAQVVGGRGCEEG